MSVVQGFSGNSQEILTSDFPCLHKPVGFDFSLCYQHAILKNETIFYEYFSKKKKKKYIKRIIRH